MKTNRQISLLLSIIIVGLVSLTACQHRTVYTHFQSIPVQGWHQDSILAYHFTIDDTLSEYNILITLRHTSRYPFQNVWMFVQEKQDMNIIHTDTIEGYMADDYGRWIGKGINNYELTLLYADNYRFLHPGDYLFTLQQGMRTEWLQGVEDVGLTINKNDGKE